MNLVHIIYLSPSDKPFVPAYLDRLADAVYDLQRWFADRLDGQTFALPEGPVVWFQTPNPSMWYEADPLTKAGRSKSFYWTRALDDAFALTGVQSAGRAMGLLSGRISGLQPAYRRDERRRFEWGE